MRDVMRWGLFEKDNKLHVLLNGGINKRLDMSHPNYKHNVQALKDEIDYFKTFKNTVVTGYEILER